MQFTKMQGAGNDYVYVDCFNQAVPQNLAQTAIAVSDRHRGIGADGMILIHPSKVADARMQMFNADGSEGEMCGNGIRCVAKFLYDHGICPKDRQKIETKAGILALELTLENGKVSQVRVDMGAPKFLPAEIPTTLAGNPQFQHRVLEVPLIVDTHEYRVNCVSMGNPHCVIFVEDLSDELILNAGPKIERNAAFPARTNVEFVKVISPTKVLQRTWERGSGETQACGTGASAVCVAGFLTGRTERIIDIQLLGGVLTLEWDAITNHVFKTGPAVEVFEGVWPAK